MMKQVTRLHQVEITSHNTAAGAFYTYLHCKPNGDPFYVGKGCGRRAYNFKANRNQHYKNTVAKYGAKNIEIYIFKRMSEQDAIQSEIRWIAQLRRDGCALVNQTDGGDGISGLKHSAEVKTKMVKAATGRKHSSETIAKFSAALKGRVFSEEHRAKLSANHAHCKTNLGRKFTEDHRKKMAKAAIGNKNGIGNKGSAGRIKTSEETQKWRLSMASYWERKKLEKMQ